MSFLTDMTTDLSVFFNTDDFALSATFTKTGGSATTIKVLFDNAFNLINLGEVGLESTNPMASCKSSDVVGVAHADTLVVSGTTYKVVGIHPDGQLITILELEKQ